MQLRSLCRAAVVVALIVGPVRAADPYSVKLVAKTPPPKELQAAISNLLSDDCIQFLDAKSNLLAEVWFRKELPSKATEAQFKNGLTLKEITESTIVGAMRVSQQLSDYRKQKVPPGVYTLRLGYQPQDGDHMGTAPHSEFCLACPAAEDTGAATIPAKKLHELSAKSTNNHPGVFLLYPGKDATAMPKLLEKKDDATWSIQIKLNVGAGR